jgi:branched-chain amino acid aminotransferase
MDFLIINGEIIRKEDANLTHLLWDEPFVLSQKIWFGFGGIPLFNKNIDFLTQQLEVFQIITPAFLKNRRELFRISKRMLNKNKFYRSGIIKIQLFIAESGIDYTITPVAFPEFDFPILEKGLLVNFSESKRRPKNLLNRHLFYNKTNWKIKRYQLRDSGFQNSILINKSGMVCEGIESNIFMIKENVLIVPSLDSGGFEDTIRETIFNAAKLAGLKIAELPNIKKEHVLEMNELFFASEEFGIQWILGVENKRFVHEITKQIHKKLNDVLKNKASE